MQFFWSPFLKIGITLSCFKISEKATDEKDKLIRPDIGLEEHILISLRIVVVPGLTVLYVFSVLRCPLRLPLLWVIRKNSFCLNFLRMIRKIWVFMGFY